jgi:hypothetical protein
MYRTFKKTTTNKYGAKGTEYNGRWYHSKFEASYASELDWRLKAGEVKEIIPQFKIELKVNDKHITNYYVDFKVILADGTIQFHEAKGFETAEWVIKWRLLEALLNEIEPGAELIIVKQQSTYKKKKS